MKVYREVGYFTADKTVRIPHSPLQILVRIAESCRPGHGPIVSGDTSATLVIPPFLHAVKILSAEQA